MQPGVHVYIMLYNIPTSILGILFDADNGLQSWSHVYTRPVATNVLSLTYTDA